MELNEVTEKLPPHLLQFVVDQPYDDYTPVDQAVWRYVMRQNYHHVRKVAHESYVKGLQMTGVGLEQIPTMYGMNRILKDIGWAAVAVDGFIPPGAFMEFTKYNVLVIAADIRTLEHIEYTPAPDVIHESAGHAPILAVPEFAAYLKDIGEAGSKAFSSHEDFVLYEAIRHLSIIKEDPSTPPAEIEAAEKEIDRIQKNMGPASEMALIRNLHWWTVEYGLIGTVEDHKIYGAGLLSSIGESMSCLGSHVKKLPYTLDAMYCNYDITKPQPQLFVTPNFAHLTTVLNEFKKMMAWTVGGVTGVQKAIDSKSTGTIVFTSGLQVSGTFTGMLADEQQVIYVKSTGPSALSFDHVQLEKFGKDRLNHGFASPVGRLSDETSRDLSSQLEIGRHCEWRYASGVVVTGVPTETLHHGGQLALVVLRDAKVTYKGKVLDETPEYFLAIGDKIASAFAGAADVEAFEPHVNVPREKMHKIAYDAKAKRLHQLYATVRRGRQEQSQLDFEGLFRTIKKEYPTDWLLTLELLEILAERNEQHELQIELRKYLERQRDAYPHLGKLVTNGLKLIRI